MSEVFDLCEGNFYRSIRVAQKGLKSAQLTKQDLAQITSVLSQATQQLNKMEIQYSLTRQSQMKVKIDLFKNQLRNYKRQLSQKQKEFEQKQQESGGSLFQMESHQKGIDPLIEAKRQMYQNEALSQEAATGLKSNNQKLMKNIARMDDIGNQLTMAQRLLGSIKKKFRKNKMILWMTLGILALVMTFVIWTYTK